MNFQKFALHNKSCDVLFRLYQLRTIQSEHFLSRAVNINSWGDMRWYEQRIKFVGSQCLINFWHKWIYSCLSLSYFSPFTKLKEKRKTQTSVSHLAQTAGRRRRAIASSGLNQVGLGKKLRSSAMTKVATLPQSQTWRSTTTSGPR